MFNLMMVMLQTSFFHAVSLSTESPPFGSSRYHGNAISLSLVTLSHFDPLLSPEIGTANLPPPKPFVQSHERVDQSLLGSNGSSRYEVNKVTVSMSVGVHPTDINTIPKRIPINQSPKSHDENVPNHTSSR